MSDYPSWSDERDSYSEATWSAPAPPHPPQPPAHYGGGNAYGGYGGSYDNRASAGYGGAGGGYGSGGGGGGYAAPPAYGAGKPTAKSGEISFDTSSRDPAHLRARVFIGCLGNSMVVREDIIELCRPFGPLMAVTLFKGYAFVQYEEAEDADNACEVLNGKRWKGVNIDVHLAMEGLVRKTLPGAKRGAEGGRGRGGGTMGGGGGGRGGGFGGGGGGGGNVNDYQGQSAAKRPRPTSAGTTMGEEAFLEVNEQNRKAAAADSSAPEMIGSEMADTLICGSCRYVTSDFVAYREHRKKQCVKPKDSVEPPVLRCSSCGLRFLNAWKMLFHLTDFHRMQLFKPDYTEEALERAKFEDDKYKNVSATRMEAWKLEQEADKTTFSVQPAAAPEEPRNGGGTPQATAKSAAATAAAANRSFANDDDVNTFGSATTSTTGGGSASASGNSAPTERVTTGADYDEDEEDEDDGMPSAIPTIG